MLTRAILKKMWPRAKADFVNGVADAAPAVFGTFNLTTPLRIAHFMAQISHESGGGTIVRENMNYSAERLFEVFGVGHHSARVTRDEADQLAHNPEAIAERVYGLGNPKKARELGNVDPGDGWKYRGGGLLQLTGRASYRKLGQVAGVDLESDPDLIADPAVSLKVAAAEFKQLGCLPYCDKDDVRQVTRRVNGGTNGLSERAEWLRRWKVALPDLPDEDPAEDEPQQDPRGAEPVSLVDTIKDSKIAKTAIGGGLTTGGIGLSDIKDGLDQANGVKDSIKDLGISPDALVTHSHHLLYTGVALVAVAVLATIAIVLWRHWDHSSE